MVESVDFDTSVPAQPMHKRWKSEKVGGGGGGKEEAGAGSGEVAARGKKRKRTDDAAVVAEGVVEDAESALPRLWSSEVRRSGSGAVVLFVDRKSARGAMKEVVRAAKESREVRWKGGEGLGVERKSYSLLSFFFPCSFSTKFSLIWRIITPD